jgi:hypothetical protein
MREDPADDIVQDDRVVQAEEIWSEIWLPLSAACECSTLLALDFRT